ncbi:MAG: hypothetical protein GY906_28400 [bacterium]|nr:hypothetical protein [bacterium]
MLEVLIFSLVIGILLIMLSGVDSAPFWQQAVVILLWPFILLGMVIFMRKQ